MTVNSHEIQRSFVMTIIQIMFIKELLSSLTTVQKGHRPQQMAVIGVSNARDRNVTPQMLIILLKMADQRCI